MRFYTNVQMVGDQFLVRGYDNGEHFMIREKFSPTLFVPANKKTNYKTLELPIELIQEILSILDRETAVLVEQALS